MRGGIPPLPQYAFVAWCSVKKSQVQLYIYLYLLLSEGGKKRRFTAFENSVLRRMFGPKREEVKGTWRNSHNEQLQNVHSSRYHPNNIR
jgi:hypothetical protein